MDLPKIFKAYDIRGIYPTEINEDIARRIGQAYAQHFQPKKVAVGRDIHLASPYLEEAVIDGLVKSGVDVIQIGLVPTDGLYFATAHLEVDGGIQLSASHNPRQFGGIKLAKKNAQAPSADDLEAIKQLALTGQFQTTTDLGQVEPADIEPSYLEFLTKFARFDGLPTLKLVANNNFGMTGLLAEKLLDKLGADQIELVRLNFQPDGNFPKGRPDPLVPENRAETSGLVLASRADGAVAWDADGDRCYIADEHGQFIEGCHLTALLAQYLLKLHPGGKVVYESRNVWAVEEAVKAAGGRPILSKAGHTLIKNAMIEQDALFGGEMSGHFYFRDFFYADNGLIPFILFLNIIAEQNRPISQLVKDLRDKYHVSGEINFKITDKQLALQKIEAIYHQAIINKLDGLSVNCGHWRFSLRPSNTEDLLRLNVEARDANALKTKTAELTELLNSWAKS